MFHAEDHTFAICAYGESPFLEECIQSVIGQSVKSNCLIATSTPNAHIRALAEKYDIPLKVNTGEPSISHDWNCAIAHCDTALVTLAHQDDTYAENYAEAMLEAMNASAKPLIFFSDYGELRGGEVEDDNNLLRTKRRLLKPIPSTGLASSTSQKRRIISLGSAICCPSVTFNVPELPNPPFLSNMKCDLDWEAWERFSRLEGDFVYSRKILMHHRIHEGSETTASIKDDSRMREDLTMLSKFWPKPVAHLIYKVYSSSQKSNNL